MEPAELKGFTRPSWGIVLFVYGGGEFKHWDLFRRGLLNGSNPKLPEFWGDATDIDQRTIELAAIGFALCLVPEHIWDPLQDESKENVSKFLLHTRKTNFLHSYFKFFKVMIDLGLDKIGVAFDKPSTEVIMDDLAIMYIDEGWYGDGANHRVDYYNPFALYFYGMIYYFVMHKRDLERSKNTRKSFFVCKAFMHWFSDDGACIPFGRSCVLRFAIHGFWAMLVFVT